MRIVVVGQGGREHALAWRLAGEGHEIVCIPGNPGMAKVGRCVPCDSDVESLADACRKAEPQLVVVGPEAPLAAGLADRLRASGVDVFGPDQAPARIEASKAFAKEIMVEAQVPTARYAAVTDEAAARRVIEQYDGRVAVKADGLAAGKGVVVCGTVNEAMEAAVRLLKQGPVVVEERLEGLEVSIIGLTDGERVTVLPASRDHKRLLDGDEGPNTGGMGAVSPVALPDGLLESVGDDVLKPVLRALEARGMRFNGALYAGLMMTADGPKVLEFNARLGDPETQALLVALDPSVNLGELLHAGATGRMEDRVLSAVGTVCTVVMASAGYPVTSRSGDVIEGLEDAEATGAVVFHAGTREKNGSIESAGGRVLGVTARGATLPEAREAALKAARLVRFDGRQLRTDIGATSA